MQLATKFNSVFQSAISFSGGLNLFEPGTDIQDTDLQESLNVMFMNQEKYLTTRTGIAFVTPTPLAHPIDKLHWYRKDLTTSHLVAASYGKLYYLDQDGDDPVWVEFATLTGVSITPSMLTYANLLVVADNDTSLKVWNGSTDAYGAVATATYMSSYKVSVVGDKTADYTSGRGVKVYCGVDGYKTSSVTGSEYKSTTETTEVTLVTTAGLTSNCVNIALANFYPIPNSPPYPTALAEIGGRLVTNSGASNEMDGVFFSGPYNEMNWDTNVSETNTDPAIIIRCGYMDGMKVDGFVSLGSDLIVSKSGGSKNIYRVKTDSSETNWSISKLSSNTNASSHFAMEASFNDVAYSNDSGIFSVQSVLEYGDLRTDFLGLKINTVLNGKSCVEMTFCPTIGAMLCMFAGTNYVYVYHPHLRAFTRFDYGLRINTVVDNGDLLYFGGNDGQLYRSTINDYDMLTEGVKSYINSRVVSKTFTFADEVIVRKTRLYYDEITPNTGVMSVIGRDGITETVIHEWSPSGSDLIYNATYKIFDANTFVTSATAGYIDTINKFRDQGVAIVLDIERGRMRIKNIIVSMANVSV